MISFALTVAFEMSTTAFVLAENSPPVEVTVPPEIVAVEVLAKVMGPPAVSDPEVICKCPTPAAVSPNSPKVIPPLELKVVPELTGLHRAQVISYLRVTGADVGLLVNFGAPRVEIERYAGFYAQRRPDVSWKPQVPDDPTLLYS